MIVCALPAYALSEVLSALHPGAAKRAAQVPYSPMAVVGLGYPKEAVRGRISGFGFLVPEIEKRKVLGAVFSSLVFPGRAPQGHELITVMMGGAKHPDIVSLPEDDLSALAADELSRMLKIKGRPVFSVCLKHEKAIPHYQTGFLSNLGALEETLAGDLPGVFLCSNAFYGVGMNDCTKRARETARAAGIFLSQTG
jgi:oxygen-dependent protoporphyrinogen oxidase